MNKTTNYNLNQWDADDRVTREDFNADNAAIDAALATIAAAASGGAKIACGTYTGDGEYGAGSPTTLTFDFEPRFVIIMPISGSFVPGLPPLAGANYFSIFVRPAPRFSYFNTVQDYPIYITWGAKSVTWYCTVNARIQLTEANVSYTYLALG